MSKVPVAVMGATGMVGQRLLKHLHQHPWFEVVAVAASERSAGKPLREASKWVLGGPAWPGGVGELVVRPCTAEALAGSVGLAMSALPGSVARLAEPALRDAGVWVVSNASAFRQDPTVPLLIPEVNPDHLSLVDSQPGPAGLVTNPNCCAMPLAIALAPLHEAFGVEALTCATWQAVSGAGYPGESAWDMVGNVHPHPGDEEEKLTEEPQKILGKAGEPADFVVSARCVRVPVTDGHLVSVQVRLGGNPGPEDVRAAWLAWKPKGPRLPSSPEQLLVLREERDRPQPRLDAPEGEGMSVVLGRLEACPVMGIKFYALAHNTVRGAAGAALLNAELLVATERVVRAR